MPLFGVLLLLGAPIAAHAQSDLVVSVQIAPPVLPVYLQPPLPEPGYIWTPGYWAYADGGYFWVPGTWVEPPQVGYLWTPGYWAWLNGAYFWNAGYWGPHVGFYGGINYGYGYGGNGYQGGRWNHGTFSYNRAVNNIGSVHVASVYTAKVSVSTRAHVSYSGGKGGIAARPAAAAQVAAHEPHAALTSAQTQHVNTARSTPVQSAAHNHGVPPIAATSRPSQFTGPGVVAARAPAPPRPRAAAARPAPAAAHPEPAAHAAPAASHDAPPAGHEEEHH
jgi:hypothetical protein